MPDIIVRNYLIEKAKKRQTVYYSQLNDDCNLGYNLENSLENNAFAELLGEISEFENEKRRPLLSSIVISKTTKKPSGGFFNLAESLGFGKQEDLQKNGFAEVQINKAFDFWTDPDKYLLHKDINSLVTSEEASIDFFDADEIIFLSKYAGKVYDKESEEHRAAKNYIMNSLGSKTVYWSNELVKQLNGFETFNWRMWSKKGWDDSSGTNKQVARFKAYTWARIFRKGDKYKDIFFTVGVDGLNQSLVFKLDYYFETNSNLNENQKELLRKNIPKELHWNEITLDNLKGIDWDSLIETTRDFISQNIVSYDNLIKLVWGEEEVKEVFKNFLRPQNPDLKKYEALPEINPSFNGVNIDFIKKNVENKELGDAGEELVLSFEKERLRNQGKDILADQVVRVKDGMGYDIFSYDKEDVEIYIEVKTTTGDQNTPFNISLNEFLFAEKNRSAYKIYRLYNYSEENNTADFLVIENTIDKLLFQPIAYRAYYKK